MSTKDLGLNYPVSNAYSHCIASGFLKSLFAKCYTKESTPGLIISDSVEQIKDEIAALNKDNIVELSPDYLSTMESSLSNAGFRYVLICKEKAPVLFVYFQVFTLSTQNFNLDENTGALKRILGFFLKLKKAKVLILGSAVRTETLSYCFDAEKIDKDEAIAAIAGVAEKIGSDECVTAVILKDLRVKTATGQRMLREMGYKMPWDDQVMEMNIDAAWNDINDYLAVLTRKYKTRANKVIASGKQLTSKILSTEEVVKHEREIKHLFATLVDKQSFTLTTSGANSIARLKKIYKDGFEVTGFFHDNKLVAFSSAFITDKSYELYYVGFDYTLNTEYQLYFNLLFTGLERAIVLKKKLLKLGRTSFDAKASIGAQAKNTDYLIKMTHIPDVVVKWFAAYFSSLEDGKWKLRNPLKAAAPLA